MSNPFDVLDQYGGQEFNTKRSGRELPGIETLANGDHLLTVDSARYDTVNVEGTDKPIVRVVLVSDNGQKVEYTYWLDRQIAFNIFAADMVTLQFPVDEWQAAGKRPSQWMPDVIRGLAGLRLRARKKMEVGKDGVARPRLYVNECLGYATPTRPAPESDEDIPF